MSDKKSFKDIMNMDIKTLMSKEKGEGKVKSKTPAKKKKLKKVVSFDIGSSTIKIAVGKYDNNKVSIEKLIDVITPDGAVNDGIIQNIDSLADIIKFTLDQNKIVVKDAICTSNSSMIINRELNIPKVDESEIDTVVHFEIQQYLPINLDDYIVQCIILDEFKDQFDSSEKYKVNVIAYPQKMARGYYELLNKLELQPHALDVTHNSINKLVDITKTINIRDIDKNSTVAFVDMGSSSIKVNIYKKGKLDFTRIIKVGGNDIDFELSQELNMSIKSTESMKIDKDNISEAEYKEKVNSIINKVVKNWLVDIERILQFYKNKNMGNTIDSIFIYGGSSNISGLKEAFESAFTISTEKINAISSVENAKSLEEPIEEYINAIAAIIRV